MLVADKSAGVILLINGSVNRVTGDPGVGC